MYENLKTVTGSDSLYIVGTTRKSRRTTNKYEPCAFNVKQHTNKITAPRRAENLICSFDQRPAWNESRGKRDVIKRDTFCQIYTLIRVSSFLFCIHKLVINIDTIFGH